jgi:hypothetical protein
MIMPHVIVPSMVGNLATESNIEEVAVLARQHPRLGEADGISAYLGSTADPRI